MYCSRLAARDWASPQMLALLLRPPSAEETFGRLLSMLNMLKLSPRPCRGIGPPCEATQTTGALAQHKIQLILVLRTGAWSACKH